MLLADCCRRLSVLEWPLSRGGARVRPKDCHSIALMQIITDTVCLVKSQLTHRPAFQATFPTLGLTGSSERFPSGSNEFHRLSRLCRSRPTRFSRFSEADIGLTRIVEAPSVGVERPSRRVLMLGDLVLKSCDVGGGLPLRAEIARYHCASCACILETHGGSRSTTDSRVDCG